MRKVRFIMTSKRPKPRCYRLWIMGFGIVAEAEDWHVLRKLAENSYPGHYITIYPVD